MSYVRVSIKINSTITVTIGSNIGSNIGSKTETGVEKQSCYLLANPTQMKLQIWLDVRVSRQIAHHIQQMPKIGLY
ncbi:predicted protein [Histoplasma mississippiense (nom. inval.)]|uniref:predicted protein n=1 Tax=Ajellomyces capsulatus (strain NAm1 / WU24) TaxID=2059318 RepID=UPI000157BFAC|nr:predicted protein [Histoplasma mississippiense (nom. inval.)]EDN06821.1 predicted protein [Histoplasma mississippiense (nom. inval.)]